MKIDGVEQEIIKKYVDKNKQERILWELDNPKKRGNVFWKFAGSDIFKKDCLQPVEYMSSDEMERHLFKLSGVRDIYFIGEDYIGELSLKEAVKRAGTGEICIIYCGNGIGYYQGEQDSGKPPRFMLIQKEN